MSIEFRDWDESKHPRGETGPGTTPGSFAPAGGGGDGGDGKETGKSNYGLVPGDAAKFRALKSQWATVNNDLLAHVDDPDGPESRALIDKLESIAHEIHGLHADPGGPAGIGLPGGPRDVVIVGAGPGGLAASINGAAEGLDTLVVEANVVAGGQAKFSSRIENFPGFPVGVTGERLTQNMFTQAGRLGAEAKLGIRVTGMTYDASTGLKHITLSNGDHVESRTVILAGGLEFRRMTFPGSEGPGVVVGDGKALLQAGKGGNVCVIGGSNGAAQAALGCAQACDHVYLLARSPIANSMSDYQIEALRNNPKVTVIEGDSIAKLERDKNGNPQTMVTAKGQSLTVKAIGAFLGSVPETKWVPADIARDKGGRLHANSDLETGLPGVYVVGDMREGAVGRVGVAVGEGQLALRQANLFLDEQRTKYQSEQAATAAKANNSADATTSALITDLFDLDRDNPWFGQTVEDVTPLKKKTVKKEWHARAGGGAGHDVSDEPRDSSGKWTSGGGSDGGETGGGKGSHPGKGYSKNAFVDKHGVIHTTNVYDAQRALFEDRKVELAQVKQVSTLIKRLGETAAEMAEHGETAPTFNLCNVSVEGTNLFCAESKGIPRVEMPVIPAKQTKAFVKYLKSQGYKVEKDSERADHLRATQSEISGAKVAASMKRIEEEGFYKRLVVSRDDYILDGHHTWAGQVGVDAKNGKLDEKKGVKVYRVDISITKLIAEAEKWTGGAGKKPASEAPKGFAYLRMDEAAALLDEDTFASYFEYAQEQLAQHPNVKASNLILTVRAEELPRMLVYRVHDDSLVQKQIRNP